MLWIELSLTGPRCIHPLQAGGDVLGEHRLNKLVVSQWHHIRHHSFVTALFIVSRVDYCNALLHGVAVFLQLQMVMNALLLVWSSSSISRRFSATSCMHWLPVMQRRQWLLSTPSVALDFRTSTMSVFQRLPCWVRSVCTQLPEVTWLCRVQEPLVSVAEVFYFLLQSSGALFHYTFDRLQFSGRLKPTCSYRHTCSE